jgi:hypothetical protein
MWAGWYPDPEVMGSTLRESIIFPNNRTNGGVPCGSPRLGHVAPCYSPTNCHVSNSDSSTCLSSQHANVPAMSTCQSSQLPCVVRLYGPATSVVWTCHVSPLKWCHMSQYNLSTYAPVHVILPTHCHVTIWSYDMYSQLPRQHYMDCTVIKILPVWKNE